MSHQAVGGVGCTAGRPVWPVGGPGQWTLPVALPPLLMWQLLVWQPEAIRQAAGTPRLPGSVAHHQCGAQAP